MFGPSLWCFYGLLSDICSIAMVLLSGVWWISMLFLRCSELFDAMLCSCQGVLVAY